MKIFRWILLHISSILAIVFITFYVLDYYNPFMNYLANPLSKTLILVLGIVTIISNELIVFDWLKGQKEQKNGNKNVQKNENENVQKHETENKNKNLRTEGPREKTVPGRPAETERSSKPSQAPARQTQMDDLGEIEEL